MLSICAAEVSEVAHPGREGGKTSRLCSLLDPSHLNNTLDIAHNHACLHRKHHAGRQQGIASTVLL